MKTPPLRSALESAVPSWAIVTDTGAPEAPHVAIWRLGNVVHLATALADAPDSCGRMEQLASTVASLRCVRVQPLSVQSFRFGSEDSAARFMRDVKRIHRANGGATKPREAEAEIPV